MLRLETIFPSLKHQQSPLLTANYSFHGIFGNSVKTYLQNEMAHMENKVELQSRRCSVWIATL